MFDSIPKVRSTSQSHNRKKTFDVKKETIAFIRTVDYARLRRYNIQDLLCYEVTNTSFYLTKEDSLRKSPKFELAQEIKKLLKDDCPTKVPQSNKKCMITIDFMGYTRKVPVKKMKLNTYADFANTLWKTFLNLAVGCSRIDVVFDLYLQQSIKQDERKRRSKTDAIETTISHLEQQLPVDMDKFWASPDNKMRFQQMFIRWAISTYKGNTPVLLGGANPGDITSSCKVSGGQVSEVLRLKCDHEEGDDRTSFIW